MPGGSQSRITTDPITGEYRLAPSGGRPPAIGVDPNTGMVTLDGVPMMRGNSAPMWGTSGQFYNTAQNYGTSESEAGISTGPAGGSDPLTPAQRARLGNRVQLAQPGWAGPNGEGWGEFIDPSKLEWDEEFGLLTTPDNIRPYDPTKQRQENTVGTVLMIAATAGVGALAAGAGAGVAGAAGAEGSAAGGLSLSGTGSAGIGAGATGEAAITGLGATGATGAAGAATAATSGAATPAATVPGLVVDATGTAGVGASGATEGIITGANPSLLSQVGSWYEGLGPAGRAVVSAGVSTAANAALGANAQRNASEAAREAEEQDRQDRIRRHQIPDISGSIVRKPTGKSAVTQPSLGLINSRRTGG